MANPFRTKKGLQGTGHDILFSLIDREKFFKVYRDLDSADKQSADLLYQVFTELQERLELTQDESWALGRIRQLLEAGSRWSPDLQRNNIFKAANRLGIDLPSGSF